MQLKSFYCTKYAKGHCYLSIYFMPLAENTEKAYNSYKPQKRFLEIMVSNWIKNGWNPTDNVVWCGCKPVAHICWSLSCLGQIQGSGLTSCLALINFGTIGHPVPCSMPCSCRMRDSPPSFISTGLTLIGPSRPHPPISGPSALGPQGTGIAPRSSFTPLSDSSQGVRTCAAV